jgi:hypothetical protein
VTRASDANLDTNLYEAALSDLKSLARGRGSLTMEDLQKALPVDRMTEQEMAHVLARLDEAGFDVEIDPTLLRPGNETPAKDAPSPVKRGETEVYEPMPGGRQQPTSIAASTRTPVLENHTAPNADPAASAPMLPWILAFAIVVVAAFAAFAY